MITEDYVSFETAKLLKEKGFDTSEIDGYFQFVYYSDGKIDFYDDDKPLFVCKAVTLQMAMKWLREVHGVTIVIDTNDIWLGKGNRFYWCKIYYKMGDRIEIKWYNDPSKPKDILRYQTYEQACEAAIKYCLEHLI